VRRIVVAFLLMLTAFVNTIPAEAGRETHEDELSKYFEGYEGTFILFDEQNNEYTVYNEA